MEKYLINPNQKISKINKDIYGHFSEHLGRCIYEGIYVGENSKIPNVKGMRCDVVNALKKWVFPFCVGRAAALRMNIIGRTVSAIKLSVKRW